MKKGFTLIELLAVIVVLAIIALIAVPVVLNIINDAKESSLLRSAEFYLDAVEYTIADAFLYHGGLSNGKYPITKDGDICKTYLPCSEENILKVEVSGDKPTGGVINIESGTISDVSLIVSQKKIARTKDNEWVDIDSIEELLSPGLYDENNNLLISWDNLTSMEYKTITYDVYHGYDEETGDEIVETINSAILNVDENGLLTSAHVFSPGDMNYSAKYLTGKLIIDDSVTGIGNSTFYSADLTNVEIPDSVTSIGDSAFYQANLTNVEIPDSVTSIESYAFYESDLTSVVLSKNLISIGGYAFSYNKLTSVTIPESVTEIGTEAFAENNLTSVIIKGKSSFNDFEYCSTDVFWPFDNITWQP